MSKSLWMPFYVADYLADTTRLTTEQHGAYLLLIMDYWRNGALPDDDDALCNITKLTMSMWKKHKPALQRMFQVNDGEWHHKRIEQELLRSDDRIEKRAAAGRASAAKRKAQQTGQQNTNIISTHVPTHVEQMLEQTGQQNTNYIQSQQQKELPSGSSKKLTAFAFSEIPPDWLAYCREKRPDLDPRLVFEKFSIFWRDRTSENWLKSWQWWVIKENIQQQQGKPPPYEKPKKPISPHRIIL